MPPEGQYAMVTKTPFFPNNGPENPKSPKSLIRGLKIDILRGVKVRNDGDDEVISNSNPNPNSNPNYNPISTPTPNLTLTLTLTLNLTLISLNPNFYSHFLAFISNHNLNPTLNFTLNSNPNFDSKFNPIC
jgi:hypothetical protein